MAEPARKEVEAVDTRPPIVVLRDKLMSRQGELRAALTDVSVESFIRAVMTSVALNPEILTCSFQSLWNSCLRACRDGLLPDGVDAALVPYKGTCSYIPMYQGLLRRFRRSGNFKWVTAGIVRSGEEFSHWIDQEGEHFKHVPGDSFIAPIVKIYAIATTKDGGVFMTVMTIEEANKIRAMTKATREDSPWKMWPEEMYKKGGLRRLSKYLPSSRDLLTEEPPEIEQTATLHGSDADLPRITGGAKHALDHFAGGDDGHTGPRSEPEQPEPEQPVGTTGAIGDQSPPDVPDTVRAAHSAGKDARAMGIQRRALPGEYRNSRTAERSGGLDSRLGWRPDPNQRVSLMRHHLTPGEKEQAARLAKSTKVELNFNREPGTPEHVAAAGLSSKLLLIAAHIHRGDDSSFIDMAIRACAIVRGYKVHSEGSKQ